MKAMFAFLYCIVYPFFNLVHPCRPIGRENVPQGAVLLCPNHTGLSDPLFVVFALGLRNRPQFMAKEEFMRTPLLGWLLKKAGVFAVKRGKSDVGAIKRAIKCLKSGDKLLLFPEGTRSKDGELGEGKTGAAMLALRTGTPIVPIYVTAPVVFGEAFYPQAVNGKGSAEEYAAITADLLSRIEALGESLK